MSSNLSKIKRNKLIDKIKSIKSYLSTNINDENSKQLLDYIGDIENDIYSKRYGLIFEEHSENIDEIMKKNTPVLFEEEDLFINNGENMNFLIEGDNLATLELLLKTHREKVDLIYIDPPYNRGENDFIYDDKYIEKDDLFKHSKWLSFMEKRLTISRKLLSETGVIIIHIDENEVFNLVSLMNDIYGEANDLGMIIWNKMNPKGDSKGVSAMHEYVLCFAKDKAEFQELENTCMRNKPNAEKIVNKAQALYKLIGEKRLPDEIKNVVKPFNYPKNILKEFEVEYTLELVNKEFQNWLSKQSFSGGEKAYKFIDEDGNVYRGVSMAWPNKKKAPDEYFIPLIHPITKKPCPVPHRGWRNPPTTMERLLKENRILFGKDEKKQPERKYFLTENMSEKTPSIYVSAANDDKFFIEQDFHFEYAKPIETLQYFIKSIHPNANTIVDFFAGSGSTGHAVMELNKIDGKNRNFILATNNQNNICKEITYERIKRVIEKEKYNESLKYFKVDYVPISDRLYYEYAEELLRYTRQLVELENGIDLIDNDNIAILLTDDEVEKFLTKETKNNLIKTIYIGHDVLLSGIQERKLHSLNIKVNIVPDYYYRELRG